MAESSLSEIDLLNDYTRQLHETLTELAQTSELSSENPIGIAFSFIYPTKENTPVVKQISLSKFGTYNDYINDIAHDAKGDRTPDDWNPISALEEYLKTNTPYLQRSASLSPKTEEIALKEATDGMIEQSKQGDVYFQYVKYQTDRVETVLPILREAKRTGIVIMHEKLNEDPSLTDYYEPRLITLDHGVSYSRVSKGTSSTESIVTFGELYDTVSSKELKKNVIFPTEKEIFNRVGCSITMKLNDTIYYIYVLGFIDDRDNKVKYKGTIFYNGESHPFFETELDANIPSIGTNTYYKNGSLPLPQYVSASIKYMGDRSYLSAVYYSMLIDNPIIFGTHDKVAFSAASNMFDPITLQPICIPCVFSQRTEGYKIGPTRKATDPTPIPSYSVFIYIIPKILDTERAKEQQIELDIRQKEANMNGQILFLSETITKITFVINELKQLRPSSRSFKIKINDILTNIEYIYSKERIIHRTISKNVIVPTIEYLNHFKNTETIDDEIRTQMIEILAFFSNGYLTNRIRELQRNIECLRKDCGSEYSRRGRQIIKTGYTIPDVPMKRKTSDSPEEMPAKKKQIDEIPPEEMPIEYDSNGGLRKGIRRTRKNKEGGIGITNKEEKKKGNHSQFRKTMKRKMQRRK